MAEIGGIDASTSRAIYRQVEAAVLGGWSAAAQAGVPTPMANYWQHEMTLQTEALRADAGR